MKTSSFFLFLFVSLSLVACGKDKPEEEPAPATTAAAPSAEAPVEPVVVEQGEQVEEAAAPETSAGDTADRKSGYEIYVAQCTNCHGDVGQGIAGNPKLAGLKVAEVDARLKAYREGKQMGARTSVMAPMAKSLTDEQIDALARYIGE